MTTRPQSTAATSRSTFTRWSLADAGVRDEPDVRSERGAARDAHRAARPAAVPSARAAPPPCRQRARRPFCAKHRHSESEWLQPCGMSQLVDEALGEEGELAFAASRACSRCGRAGPGGRLRSSRSGSRTAASPSMRGSDELAACPRRRASGRALRPFHRPSLPPSSRQRDPAFAREAPSFARARRTTRGPGSGSRSARASTCTGCFSCVRELDGDRGSHRLRARGPPVRRPASDKASLRTR